MPGTCRRVNIGCTESVMGVRRLLVALLLALAPFAAARYAFAASYYIAQAGLPDHADPTARGSIAWYFTKYGGGNEYVLTTAPNAADAAHSVYQLGRTLEVPTGAVLRGKTLSQLKANAGLDNRVMLELHDYSIVANLDLHGSSIAGIIVRASHRVGVEIYDSTIHNTKNDYTSDAPQAQWRPRPHLIVLDACTHAYVARNILRRAGCAPKLNPELWDGVAAAIYAPRNTDLTVDSNDIAFTLSAGIDLTGTVGADITDNVIRDTGLNALYPRSAEQIADGITAYQNLNGGRDQNIWITYNEISAYHNHGIHLSGRGVHVEHNNVHDGTFNAIRIADQRSPPDCASNFSIRHNTAQAGRANYPSIYIDNYAPASYDVSDNSWNGRPVGYSSGQDTCR